MPRPPSFEYRKTSKGWLVHIPGSVSDTGQFRRRYFKTRDEAKAECQRLRELNKGLQTKAIDIAPELAADAMKARELLGDYDITAKDIVKALDQTTKGQTRWKAGLRYISAVLGDVVKTGGISENLRQVQSAIGLAISSPPLPRAADPG